MPFKNEQRYLKPCLDSIANQSFADFEVHMCDDHSSDSSTAIAQEFAQQDQRFILHTNREQGIIDALLSSLSHCTGTLLTRMDGDDLMPQRKLQLMSEKLIEAGPRSVLVGKTKYFSEKEISEGYHSYEQWLHRIHQEESFLKYRFKECVIPSCAWMMFREDFIQALPKRGLQYPEDYHLMLEWMHHGYQIKSLDKVVHHWRDHEQRISKTHEHYQIERFFKLKLQYILQEHGNRKILLWGKGKRSEDLMKLMTTQGLYFHALSNPTMAKQQLKSICENENILLLCTLGEGIALEDSIVLFEQLGLKINQDFFLL